MSQIIVKEADPIIGRCLEALDAIKRSGKEETEYTAGYEAGKAVGILEGVIAELQRRERGLTFLPIHDTSDNEPKEFISMGPDGGMVVEREDGSIDKPKPFLKPAVEETMREFGEAKALREAVLAAHQVDEVEKLIESTKVPAEAIKNIDDLPKACLSLGPEGMKLEPMKDDSDEDEDEGEGVLAEKKYMDNAGRNY